MLAARLRLALLGALLVGASVWLLVAGGPSRGDIEHAVRDAGWLAPAGFVAIYIGWTVLLLPGVVPTLAGGTLFGVLAGSLLTLLGATIGATLAFALGRRLGRAAARDLSGPRSARFDRWMRRRGFMALLYLRLVPVVPFNLLNYAAGVTGISTRAYVTATAVGIVPGTVAYTALGATAGHPGSVPFLVSLAAVAALTAVAVALARRGRRSDANLFEPSA